MPETDMVDIPRSMAVKIADFMKEELDRLDIELQHAKTERISELALNLLIERKRNLRAIYDELKSMGVEGLESTMDMLDPPVSPHRR